MLAAAGGLLFLGFAVLILLGLLTDDLVFRIAGAAMFGFFGVLMTLGALAGTRQGSDTRVAEIGPDGAWLPGMGRIPWNAIAEVRLERIRGVGSSSAPVTRQIRRLGFVPRDGTLRADAATHLLQRMTGWYYRLVKAMVPEVRLGGDSPAPFGVSELDIPRDFERLIEMVGGFVPVTDAAEARARATAPTLAARHPAAPAPAPDLATLDAALAPKPAGSRSAAATAPRPQAGAVLAPPPVRQPRAAFGVPAIGAPTVVFSVVPFAAPLVVIVPILLPQVVQGGTGAVFGLLFIAVFGVGFAVPGMLRTVRLIRRARERRADPVRLRVDPDGIWTRDGGPVAWADVREVRTERAGFERSLGLARVERWRLVVEPATPARPRGTATSDELDAPFDEVLDVIRCYHPVVEAA